jgi:hypothetical protein
MWACRSVPPQIAAAGTAATGRVVVRLCRCALDAASAGRDAAGPPPHPVARLRLIAAWLATPGRRLWFPMT